MSLTASTNRRPERPGPRRAIRGRTLRRARSCVGAVAAGAVAAGGLAAVAALTPASASTSSTGTARLARAAPASLAPASLRPASHAQARDVLSLRAMPAGTVSFGRHHGHLTVRARMFGLTPDSAHQVDLATPGRSRTVRFSTLTASSAGQADSVLHSDFAGRLPRGSRLLVLMGARGDRVGRVGSEPIAETARLRGRRPHRLIAVEVSQAGVSYGTPRGRAAISYDAKRQRLTVTVSASGVTPGPHAAHIHLGSCQSQGPVKYMLKDLIADRRGRITRAVRVFRNVTSPIPAHGWYLNIHQGNSGNILSNGQPTILFRPLICANIRTGTISSILRTGDVVTGVRGATDGKVVLTGGKATGNGTQNDPFLFRGRLTSAAAGAAVSVLRPPFPGVTSATFYGPDTHSFNPRLIPSGQVRAVGAYTSSSAPAGVVNRGLIYLGPVNGSHGSWTSIAVPAHGAHTVGPVRACPRSRPQCFVMDTIAHSTMGDLVVGNYDLRPGVHAVISANAFIYDLTSKRWTLLRLGGSMSSQTTLYGIWQDGGHASTNYTLAGGSRASGHKRAFLMNYNERTGRFGAPKYFSFGHGPTLLTHFEGITAVPGGFNLVAGSSAQASSMAFVPVHNGTFGAARWHPVNVAASPLCAAGCSAVTGNTVYRNKVMGLYGLAGAALPGTYLARLPSR